jgi:hypothetical protein
LLKKDFIFESLKKILIFLPKSKEHFKGFLKTKS